MAQMGHALFDDHAYMFIIQRIEHRLAFLAIFHKVILTQNPQLMGHGRLAHFQGLCQFAHVSLPFQKDLQDANTGAIAKNLEKLCQFLNELLLQFLFHIKFFLHQVFLHSFASFLI